MINHTKRSTVDAEKLVAFARKNIFTANKVAHSAACKVGHLNFFVVMVDAKDNRAPDLLKMAENTGDDLSGSESLCMAFSMDMISKFEAAVCRRPSCLVFPIDCVPMLIICPSGVLWTAASVSNFPAVEDV